MENQKLKPSQGLGWTKAGLWACWRGLMASLTQKWPKQAPKSEKLDQKSEKLDQKWPLRPFRDGDER